MKRIYLILIVLATINISCIAQETVDSENIVGVWQANNPNIGSAYQDNYQFFKDGRFVFNLSQYNELNRIVSIKGTYSLNNDTIYFKTLSLKERTGGDMLVRSRTTSMNDSWSLAGNFVYKETNLGNSDLIPVPIEICKDSSITRCILIEGERFYLILNDPNDY